MLPKLYGEFAPWYTLLTAPEDYEEEAAWYEETLRAHAQRELRTMLELGCGAGANASFMKRSFEMVLVDLSAEMLAECRKLNPRLELHEGDMRTVRLGRRFDAVFVHDAVSYMLDESDARALAQTVAEHLEPGGVALICPDDLAENFTTGIDSGGNDGPDGRGVRYLAWSRPGVRPHTAQTDYAMMLRDSDGEVRVVHDRHVTGCLPRETWFDALRGAGLEPDIVELEHSEVEAGTHHVLVAVRPAG